MDFEYQDKAFFDMWAATYDADVDGARGFPFTGYSRVLTEVVLSAQASHGMSVLDLGTGTGALAGLFLRDGCEVWGTDFSGEMIQRAKSKYPEGKFFVADLQSELPAGFPERFDRVVSAYAFHHLELESKLRLIHRLCRSRLKDSAKLVVADVSFPTARDRESAALTQRDVWDAEEHYWAADEVERALLGTSVTVAYSQVSACAGLYRFAKRVTTDLDG